MCEPEQPIDYVRVCRPEVAGRSLSNLLERMVRTLEALHEGKIPDENVFNRDDLRRLTVSLVGSQRFDLSRSRPGSWCIADDDHDMPADVRVEFIFKPTYVAVAILTHICVNEPDIARGVRGLDRALSEGFRFCCHRRLRGKGAAADDDLLDAVRVLSLGGVPEYVASHPRKAARLRRVLLDTRRWAEERLESGNTAMGWQQTDHTPALQAVVERLAMVTE